jgi:hypothetical protein
MGSLAQRDSSPTTLSSLIHLSFLLLQQDASRRHPREVRSRVSRALHNIVHAQHPPGDKQRKKEAKVLKLLETLRMYGDLLRDVRAVVDRDTSEEMARHGCRPVCVRISSASAARAAAASGEVATEELLFCGKTKIRLQSFSWHS